MAHLTPAEAIETCETALRQLLNHVLSESIGSNWLQQQATAEKLAQWEHRREEERKKRQERGVATVPVTLLAYVDLFSLRSFADKNWHLLSTALGKKAETGALLKRLDDLRNSVAHSRPLVPFEVDLAAGIAGEIRNRVTTFMSTRDDAGELYPRIEFAQDHLGHSIDPIHLDAGGMGGGYHTNHIVYEGEVITFTLRGSDPQNRNLIWWVHASNRNTASTITSEGETATLRLKLDAGDVREELTVGIFMQAEGTPYHRSQHGDHRVFWYYKCRPRPNQ